MIKHKNKAAIGIMDFLVDDKNLGKFCKFQVYIFRGYLNMSLHNFQV